MFIRDSKRMAQIKDFVKCFSDDRTRSRRRRRERQRLDVTTSWQCTIKLLRTWLRFTAKSIWRRRWDLNPRKVSLHTISNRADSAALALLHRLVPISRIEYRLARLPEPCCVVLR